MLPLRNEMKKPQDFTKPLGVLNVVLGYIGIVLIAVGSIGYLKFGDDVKGSLTLNLDQTSM